MASFPKKKKLQINDRKPTFPSHPREACQIRMDCYVFWQTEAKRNKITMFYYILMIMEIILHTPGEARVQIPMQGSNSLKQNFQCHSLWKHLAPHVDTY